MKENLDLLCNPMDRIESHIGQIDEVQTIKF